MVKWSENLDASEFSLGTENCKHRVQTLLPRVVRAAPRELCSLAQDFPECYPSTGITLLIFFSLCLLLLRHVNRKLQ